MKNTKQKTCENALCLTLFQMTHAKQKYCCVPCANIGMRKYPISFICEECEKESTPSPSKRCGRRFCKLECYEKNKQKVRFNEEGDIISSYCQECKETLPIGSFNYNRRTKHGRECYCSSCSYIIKTARKLKVSKEEIKRFLTVDICQICGSTDKRLVIDHDHLTNKIRGRICEKCNVVIGFVDENIQILYNIISYIQSHKPVELF